MAVLYAKSHGRPKAAVKLETIWWSYCTLTGLTEGEMCPAFGLQGRSETHLLERRPILPRYDFHVAPFAVVTKFLLVLLTKVNCVCTLYSETLAQKTIIVQ